MKRRDFITQGGLAAAASMLVQPIRLAAQQTTLPVVGFLGGTAPCPEVVAPFVEGLAAAGFSDGRNVTVLRRWAHNQPDRLPALAADLLRNHAVVIATNGGAGPVRVVKAANASVPVVFLVGADPVTTGLVESLGRPGGKATGVYMLTSALNAKRLQFLHEMVPRAATMAVLINPTSPVAQAIENEVRAAAAAARVQVQVARAGSEREIDAAFASLAAKHVGALIVTNDPFFASRREQLVALTTRHALPAIFEWREFAAGGGLMSFGTDRAGALREQGAYVARILKGARPGDLPILQPTRFELVINRKTAKGLGLAIPQSLFQRADEVIE